MISRNLWPLNFGLLLNFHDVTVTLIQNVLIFVSNTSLMIKLVHFIINDWNYLAFWKKLVLSVAFSKCFSIFSAFSDTNRNADSPSAAEKSEWVTQKSTTFSYSHIAPQSQVPWLCVKIINHITGKHVFGVLRRGKTQTPTQTGAGPFSYRSLAVYHDGVPHVFVSRFIAQYEESCVNNTSIWSFYFPFI